MTKMKNAISKALALLAVLSLAAAVHADDDWTLRVEQGSLVGEQFVSGYFVNGVSEKGAAKVWLNPKGTGVNGINFRIAFDSANLTPTAVLNESVITDANATKKANIIGGNKINIQVSASGLPPKVAIASTDEEILLATITYDVTDPAAGVGLGELTMGPGSCTAVDTIGDGVDTSESTGITVEPLLQQGGYIGELEGKPEFPESQDGATTYTIEGADLFPEVYKFNLATMAYDIPVAVKITAVTVGDLWDVDGSALNYVEFDEGTGVISITPPAFLNNTFPDPEEGHMVGQFEIFEMTVVDADTGAAISDNLWSTTVTITDVDTDPELEAGYVVFNPENPNYENQALAATTQFTAIYRNYDEKELTPLADHSLTIGDTTYTDGEIATFGGDWNPTTRAYEYNVTYTPGDTYKPAYDTVVHDDEGTTTASVPFTMTVDGASADFEDGFLVTDVNQATAIDTWTVTADGEDVAEAADIYADSEVDTVVVASDSDAEDEPVVTDTAWTDNGTDIEGAPEAFLKGHVYTVKGIATAAYPGYEDNTAETEAVTLTVVNSAPVAHTTSAKLFIQKGEQTDGSVLFAAPADVSDVDVEDELSIKEASLDYNNEYFTVTIVDGMTVNVAVKAAWQGEEAEEIIGSEVKFAFTDGDADTALVTLTVDYRKDPPPVAVEDLAIDPEAPEEGTAFMATITVADLEEAVEPSGIDVDNVAWTLLDGEDQPVDPELYELEADAIPVEPELHISTNVNNDGTQPYLLTATITASQDLIQHPNADGAFKIKVVVPDGNGATATFTKEFTLTDVDRLPEVPANLAITEEAPVAATEALNATADAGDDEDDDETAVAYKWSYKAPADEDFTDIEGATEATLANSADYFKKGYTLRVSAKTSTFPYGGDLPARSEETATADITIGNTAPELATVEQDGEELEITDGAVEAKCTEWCGEDEGGFTVTVTVNDPDVSEEALDSLTWAVTLSNEEAGTIEPTAAEADLTGAFSFTFRPVEHFNTLEGGELFATVTATDEDGEAVELMVNITVTEINDQPVIAAGDAYVLPDERGQEKTHEVTIKTLGDTYEDEAGEQTIKAADVALAFDADFFATAPTVTGVADGKITLTFTVKEDAELGESTEITVTATDDGTTDGAADPKASEPVTFKVYVGASPWYPIISFECEDEENHAGHTLVLSGSDGSEYAITLKGENYALMPGDYAKYGVPGYADDTTVQVKVYVWSRVDGTTDEECCEVADQVVNAYGLPGDPSAEGGEPVELEADENGWVEMPAISFPMAKSYTINVYSTDGTAEKLVQTIGPVDFAPNENGIILPALEAGQMLQLTEAGSYSIYGIGTNPNGEGEEALIATVTVEDDSDPAGLAWPEDGVFTPVGTLTSTTVKFSWPVANGAESYQLQVFGPSGAKIADEDGIKGNDFTLTLPSGNAATYTWNVIATAGRSSLASDLQQFNVANTSGGVVVEEATAKDDSTVTLKADVDPDSVSMVTIAWEYYSMANNKWTYGKATGVDVDEEMDLALNGTTVQAGDFIFIRVYNGNKALTDWVPYELQ